MQASPDFPDLVPARMLNEYVYCPRLAWLEWVEGEFEHNPDTLQGQRVHRRVDAGIAASLPEAFEEEAAAGTLRSVMASCAKEGLIARMDLLEHADGCAIPVDYKKGSPPDNPFRAHDPERVQICAQALILRGAGWSVDHGILYFAETRQRIEIPIDHDLVTMTRAAAAALRGFADAKQAPEPLVDSPKCPRCSLVGICLPDEVKACTSGDDPEPRVRRLAPARDPGVPLHVVHQGARVGKRGELLEVTSRGERLGQARLRETSSVCLYGNVQITTQAQNALADLGIPICTFTSGGWFRAMTTGTTHKNVLIRIEQHRAADDPERSLRVARSIVSGKIQNARTLLRRNATGLSKPTLDRLEEAARSAQRASALDSLLGIEGAAARLYFENFPAMLKTEELAFAFEGRNRRPPRDPVNATLSFLYAILTRELTVAVTAAGFDPYRGFYHQPRYGRPALALDLAEEFRSIIADSTALTLINKQELRPSHFVIRKSAANLTEQGRRIVLAGYERRMDALVRHPRFDYSISYRKILQIQARLLSRHLMHELAGYPTFRTR